MRVWSDELPSTKTWSRPISGIVTTPIGVPGRIGAATGTVAAARLVRMSR